MCGGDRVAVLKGEYMGVSGLERNLTVVEVVNLMMIRRCVECTEI